MAYGMFPMSPLDYMDANRQNQLCVHVCFVLYDDCEIQKQNRNYGRSSIYFLTIKASSNTNATRIISILIQLYYRVENLLQNIFTERYGDVSGELNVNKAITRSEHDGR